jgi:hypothetical protein
MKRLGVFKSKTKAKKAVHLAFITSNGLINNEYSAELIQNEIELDAMFLSL